MEISQPIVDYAGYLFDAAGITQLSETDNLLILGLESTPERNLDEFGYADSHFQMRGYEKMSIPSYNRFSILFIARVLMLNR